MNQVCMNLTLVSLFHVLNYEMEKKVSLKVK